MSPTWVLVGPPGSGKTTVGEGLAARLDLGFRDTDADLEERFGKPVSQIFVDDGEPAFRDAEVEAVAAALGTHDGVLALGGGAPLRAETQAALRGHRVVFLDVSLSEATKRVGMSGARPLLMGNVRGTLKRLMDERRPVYESVAIVTVLTDGLAADEVVAQILEHQETSA